MRLGNAGGIAELPAAAAVSPAGRGAGRGRGRAGGAARQQGAAWRGQARLARPTRLEQACSASHRAGRQPPRLAARRGGGGGGGGAPARPRAPRRERELGRPRQRGQSKPAPSQSEQLGEAPRPAPGPGSAGSPGGAAEQSQPAQEGLCSQLPSLAGRVALACCRLASPLAGCSGSLARRAAGRRRLARPRRQRASAAQAPAFSQSFAPLTSAPPAAGLGRPRAPAPRARAPEAAAWPLAPALFPCRCPLLGGNSRRPPRSAPGGSSQGLGCLASASWAGQGSPWRAALPRGAGAPPPPPPPPPAGALGRPGAPLTFHLLQRAFSRPWGLAGCPPRLARAPPSAPGLPSASPRAERQPAAARACHFLGLRKEQSKQLAR